MRHFIAIFVSLLSIAAFGDLTVTNKIYYEWTGNYENETVIIDRVLVLDIKDVETKNCKVTIAGSKNIAINGWVGDGGTYDIFPGPYGSGMNNSPAWIGDNISIPGLPAQNWKRNWIAGNSQIVTVPLDHLKADITKIYTAFWKLSDSAGKRFTAKVDRYETNLIKRTATFYLRLNGSAKPGPGFWTCYEPAEMVQSITAKNLRFRNHEYFAVYFAKRASFTDSEFAAARLDYNLGFEHCAIVSLQRVRSHGNHSVQGNGADVAFISGVQDLVVRLCEIAILAVTSGGWETSVDADMSVSFLDWETGWFGRVIEEGVQKRDAAGLKPIVQTR